MNNHNDEYEVCGQRPLLNLMTSFVLMSSEHEAVSL